ncbi:hypothetical protein [Sphingorhabdus sp. EL138]|uniref:hypothetical protein n=1 Tax=Sphingorhabdus sp. EL138 TaxID=2073156 RepID=UPI0025E46346|nr:hypothetical protein [Sphingorhabdus sp. EL138]
MSALTQKPPAADAMTSKNPNIHFFILLPQILSFDQSDQRNIDADALGSTSAIHQIIAAKRSKFIAKAGW